MRHHVLAALFLVSGAAAASVADQSHRSQIAGVDLITYHTDVKDVVVILGSLPAGDAMAEPGNIAVPTLAGMMLDRGTKKLDKFAIAEQLDNVGAEIAFSVGTQSLEIRAKCLKKDLPLVIGLIAAELRTPALQPHRRAGSLGEEHGSARAGSLRPRNIPAGPPQPAAHGQRLQGGGEGRNPR